MLLGERELTGAATRFQDRDSETTDYSYHLRWQATESLARSFDLQHVIATTESLDSTADSAATAYGPAADLTGSRRKVGVDDPRIEDRVADNVAKFEITESESLLFGTDFGLTTDILQGPDGALYVSTSNGSGDRILRVDRR